MIELPEPKYIGLDESGSERMVIVGVVSKERSDGEKLRNGYKLGKKKRYQINPGTEFLYTLIDTRDTEDKLLFRLYVTEK